MGGPLLRLVRNLKRLLAVSAAAAVGLWEHRDLPPDASRQQAAEWLHRSLARALTILSAQLTTVGRAPSNGLIVSNHVSYFDILALSAAIPCVFISKAEVEHWPVIGRYARWAGCVFVRRHDRADAARANDGVAESLRGGVPVVLFPEGTTTDGSCVLRFHSTMLQPAIDASAVVTPCAIRYALDDGNVAQDVCWWGDMRLLPHIWKLLGKKGLRVNIAFGEPVTASGDRKELSHHLRQLVVMLHDQIEPGRNISSLDSEPARAPISS